MRPHQLENLANQFVAGTLGVSAGKKVWVQWGGDQSLPIAKACMTKIRSLGADVHEMQRGSDYLNALLSKKPSREELEDIGRAHLEIARDTDFMLRIMDAGDGTNLKDHGTYMDDYQRCVLGAYGTEIVSNTQFLVVNAPTQAFAQACGMDLSEFEEFYSRVYGFDHRKMDKPALVLEKMMAEAKSVSIRGKGTKLDFSIEGIPAKACTGQMNFPDGEVFTAPVKGSMEGYVAFGPSVYQEIRFSALFLRYSQGKVIEAKAPTKTQTRELNRILDTDEGARYPGEFALAFHPEITEPVGDILFDEKMRESFHIAMGSCYAGYADNGNESAIHWDMIRKGGEIRFDGRLIRKDGIFVVPELEGLNPDRLTL